jgi:hypothetical protein
MGPSEQVCCFPREVGLADSPAGDVNRAKALKNTQSTHEKGARTSLKGSRC